jgi:threonine synthase
MLTLDPLARAPRPTLAFKDLGMCLLVEVLDYFLAQDQRRLCLVVWVSK